MSRYPLSPRTDAPQVARAAIGWDRPLRTFFVQVFAADDEDGEAVEILWEGTYPGEIGTVADAIERVCPFAIVPDDLSARLEADRRDGHDRRDGPAQTAAKRLLF